MEDYLRKTLRSLRALGDDRRSGAAQISERAVSLLANFCRKAQPGDRRLPYALGELAEAARLAHPSMGPLLNLANRLQLAAEKESFDLRRLRTEIEQSGRRQAAATKRVARLLAARLLVLPAPSGREGSMAAGPRRTKIITYSYSSTVLVGLLAAGRPRHQRERRLSEVIVSEARPQQEGRVLAGQLAEHGIPVTLVPDSALLNFVREADAVVVGADAVMARSYVNKTGTAALQESARAARKPFFVLACRSKFLSPALAQWLQIEESDGGELWKGAPAGVRIMNQPFELVPRAAHVTVLWEEGELRGHRMPAGLNQEPVAARWKQTEKKGRSG